MLKRAERRPPIDRGKDEKMKSVKAHLAGEVRSTTLQVDSERGIVMHQGQQCSFVDLSWNPPVTGTVYGVLLNYRGKWAEWEDQFNQRPYERPPQEPILYIKPLNTLSSCNEPIPLPSGQETLQVGASLAVVIGKDATRVKAGAVDDYIAGYTIANDVSIPHDNIHRPPILQKARDGFCPVGPWIVSREDVINPGNIDIRLFVNGQLKQKNHTRNLIRSIPQLIEEVTAFMTLQKGDLLLVGEPENAPLVKDGDHIRIEMSEIGVLENTVVAEEKAKEGGQTR